ALSCGHIDWDRKIIKLSGVEIKLSNQENVLFQSLFENPDTTIPRDDLIKKIWGSNFIDELYLTQLIYRLRKSLCATGLNERIITIPREGYRFKSILPDSKSSTSDASRFARQARGISTPSAPTEKCMDTAISSTTQHSSIFHISET